MGAIAPDINARVLTAREIARGATVSPTGDRCAKKVARVLTAREIARGATVSPAGDRCAKKSYRPQAIGAM